MNPKIIYLAQPYSNTDPAIMRHRRDVGAIATAYLMARGYVVFAPIPYGCAVVDHLPTALARNHDFWMSQDLPLLAACDELWILPLPGGGQSVGMNTEIAFAENNAIPVVRMEDNRDLLDAYLYAIERAHAAAP